jgi:uncharacterized protein YkwD
MSTAIGTFRQYWKVIIVVALVAAGAGLATMGQLQPLVSDLERAADTAVDAGRDGGEVAEDVFSNDLDPNQVERLVHERVNEIRANRSLQTLEHNPELREIARQYSRRMATEGFYSHTGPDGETFEDRYAAAGYDCRVPVGGNQYVTGGENIQYTFAFTDVRVDGEVEEYDTEMELANAIVEMWMRSSSHRQQILEPFWRNEGIGVYAVENPDGPGKKVYVTQNFC